MKLFVVGFGCGRSDEMTAEAEHALMLSDVIIGYKTYTDIIKEIFPPGKDFLSKKRIISSGMREEISRVETALSEARNYTVSLICSGDPELYGMAALAYEIGARYPEVEIEIVPGVTAAFSGGALLGSPLTNDLAVISLSDLITPRQIIEKRLRCASDADFVIVLYNPSSKKRPDHLKNACDIILEYRPESTICGYTRNIGRINQQFGIMTLSEMRLYDSDMFTTIFIGNSDTRIINGKMITPRGYFKCSDQ